MYSTSQFYVEEYFGNEIPLDDINKYLSRASDELDTLTYGRLIKAYPTEQYIRGCGEVCFLFKGGA